MIDAETAAFLKVMFDLFPESIRQELLGQDDFRLKFGLSGDTVMTLSPGNVSLPSAALFKAVREILARPNAFTGSIQVEKTEWQVALNPSKAGPRLLLCRGEQRMGLPDFTALSPDSAERLSWFDKQANDVSLDRPTRDKWQRILSDSPASDQQVDLLLNEFALTPKKVFSGIERQLELPDLELAALISADKLYYARLIGELSDQSKLEDAIKEVIGPHASRLRSQDEKTGLRFALLLCGTPLISDTISAELIEHDALTGLLEWAEAEGDLTSKIAAAEIALAKCKEFPDIEPAIARLVRFFTALNPEDENGRLALLTGLWMLVDGQLSMTGVLKEKPPFWRKLAANAQASMIERAMAHRLPEFKTFLDSVRRARGQTFYMQGLVDLRREPRWLPDFITPEQIKAEFVSRLTGAAHKAKDHIQSDELRTLLYGKNVDALPAQMKFPQSYLPGPLEGGMPAILDMPADIQIDLRTKLDAERITPNSFAALANSPLIFKISPNTIELAADTLRRVKYQLSDPGSSGVTFSLLFGLATAAAVTKSLDLAQQVQILMRITRRKPGATLDVEDYLRTALMASASHSEIGAWSESVGNWLTEYALGELDKDAAATLSSHIHVLCRIEPTLWTTCAKADAACMARAA